MAQRYHARPSAIIGIGHPLAAYDFDVTVAQVTEEYRAEETERRRLEREDPWTHTPNRIIDVPEETPEEFEQRLAGIRRAFGDMHNVGK